MRMVLKPHTFLSLPGTLLESAPEKTRANMISIRQVAFEIGEAGRILNS